MSEWKPISTAPVGVRVKLGRWSAAYGIGEPDYWRQSCGIAKVQGLFGPRLTDEGRLYSYWAPFPPPPAQPATAEGVGS